MEHDVGGVGNASRGVVCAVGVDAFEDRGEFVAADSEDEELREAELREAIKDCDRKIERYRVLLDQDGDVVIAARWITEAQRERRALEAQLGHPIPSGKMTTEQVKALVTALRDIIEVLADAEPADKTEFYNELGVTLRYHPNGTVAVKAHPRGVNVRVRRREEIESHWRIEPLTEAA